ncbi:MAG: PHB depolymerase family esterase [Planctomycetota bacterium]
MRFQCSRLAAAAALAAGGLASPSWAITDQEILDISSEGTSNGYPYRYIAATEASPTQKKPLVVFLHGLGQGGNDNVQQVTSHINPLVDRLLTSEYNAHLLAPQSFGSFNDARLALLIEDVIGRHADTIDTDRVYVTGISAGGAGTYNIVNERPNLFAAAVPLSGGQKPEHVPNLAGTPMWVFTGETDTLFRAITAQNMYNALQSAGDTPRLTQIENVAHSGWSNIYADRTSHTGTYLGGSPTDEDQAGLYDWLFAQSRSNPASLAPRDLADGERVLIDFGLISENVDHDSGGGFDNVVWLPPNPDDEGNYWNHPQNTLVIEDSPIGTLVEVSHNTEGVKTRVGFHLTDDFNDDGKTGVTDDTLAPGTVVGDGWYVGTNAASTTKAQTAAMVIDGLIAGGVYELALLAAAIGNDGGRGYLGWYWVNGVMQAFDAAGNTDTWLVFEDVVANADGEIELFFQVSQDEASRSRRAYLNAIELTAVRVPEPGVLAMALLGVMFAARRPRRVGQSSVREA